MRKTQLLLAAVAFAVPLVGTGAVADCGESYAVSAETGTTATAEYMAAAEDLCPNPTATVKVCIGDKVCKTRTDPPGYVFAGLNGNCPPGTDPVVIADITEAISAAQDMVRRIIKLMICSKGCTDMGWVEHIKIDANCAEIKAEKSCVPIMDLPKPKPGGGGIA